MLKKRCSGTILTAISKDEFEKIKMAIVHHAGEDYVASRGEYLNSMILAAYLGYDFIDAESAIFFFENGSFDAEKTNQVMAETLAEHERAVIPGFYGVMPDGSKSLKDYPHYFIIDLGNEHNIGGMQYLPRMESHVPGSVKDYKIYVK